MADERVQRHRLVNSGMAQRLDFTRISRRSPTTQIGVEDEAVHSVRGLHLVRSPAINLARLESLHHLVEADRPPPGLIDRDGNEPSMRLIRRSMGMPVEDGQIIPLRRFGNMDE